MRVAPTFGLGWEVEEIEGEDAMFGPFASDIAADFEARLEATGSDRLAQVGWLTDRARRIKSPVFGRGEDMSQVGGQAVLTTITRGAIETRIIRSWPDRIGERIECTGGQRT